MTEALTKLEVVSKLSRLSPSRKIAKLYELRHALDDETFRAVATLLAIDLSRGENPKRWTHVDDVEKIEETSEGVADEEVEDVEIVEVLQDDEYLGQRVVEKIWR
ncbi:MAG: hypothetical protein ACK4M3_03750 [Pyrobaculum sp.]